MLNQTDPQRRRAHPACPAPRGRAGPGCGVGRGSGEGTGVDAGRPLEPAHRRLGLLDPAAGLQEAHRLGQPPPDDDGVQRGQRPERQRPAPAVVAARDDEVADQRRQRPADRPERLEQHDHPSAHPGRRELADQRRGHRQLGAQAQADEEAEHQQGADRPRQRGGAGREPEDQQGDRRRPGAVRTGRPAARRAWRPAPSRRSRSSRSTTARSRDSSHCTASAAMTKEMSPTSMASSAQPSPEPTTSRPCSRVNGSRSSRSARGSGVSVAVMRSSLATTRPDRLRARACPLRRCGRGR